MAQQWFAFDLQRLPSAQHLKIVTDILLGCVGWGEGGGDQFLQLLFGHSPRFTKGPVAILKPRFAGL